jgi:hypothetical protein
MPVGHKVDKLPNLFDEIKLRLREWEDEKMNWIADEELRKKNRRYVGHHNGLDIYEVPDLNEWVAYSADGLITTGRLEEAIKALKVVEEKTAGEHPEKDA